MGCKKLTYSQGENRTPFLQIWKRGAKEKPPLFFCDALEKNPATPNFCNDYTPFGLTFNSYTSGTENLYKFQGQEEQKETGWVQFKWRNHDPALGRFFNVDPLAEDYVYNSPYAFQENKLGRGTELEGLELREFNWLAQDVKAKWDYASAKVNQALDNAGDAINNAKNAVVDGIKNLDKAFSEGGSGSVLTSKNFSNSETNARTNPEKIDGEINVDELIGPTLRANPAGSMMEGVAHGVEMVTTIEGATGVIENAVRGDTNDSPGNGSSNSGQVIKRLGGSFNRSDSTGTTSYINAQGDTVTRHMSKEEIFPNLKKQ